MFKKKLWQFISMIAATLILSVSAQSEEIYTQNFDDFDDGEIELGDGSIIAGAAASIQGGRLQLTIDGQGLGFSSFSIPPLEGSSQGFKITFDYEMFDSVGANDPADGFSINYGGAAMGELGGAEEGMTGKGVQENLSFEVDTWRNGDAEQGVNISGYGNGRDLGQLAFTNGVILDDGQTVEGTVEISWYPGKGASFITTGLNTNADFVDVETGNFVASDDHTFIFSARVGGANQDLFIDNLIIETGAGGDSDGDGLPDFWETANDLDPEDDTGENGADGDPDNDGITNFDEYENGTNPQNEDTDGDGLADGVENGTGDYDGPEATGTDPLVADSDGDTLLDGVENPTLPYDEDDPESQPGTDPNQFDTDGDGIGDGSEVASGTDPTTEDEADENSYRQNFDGFTDGTTDLQDGTVIAGAAAEVVEGRLQLTKDGQGLGFSSFSVPAIPGSSNGFRITFDYELYDSPGANDPADGFSINYGDAQLGELGQAEEGMAGGQAFENISFEVDTWQNFDAEQGVNISGMAGGADLQQLAFNNGPILNDGEKVEGTIEIQWQPDVGASFTTTGMNTNADFTEVEIPDFVASDDHNFIISARVGGANQDFFIDNLVIEAGIFDGDEDEDNLPDFYENDKAGNLTDLNGLGDGPGPGAGTGDFDGDGVTDFDEYENKTDPTEEDTDQDGLADGVENGSGDYDGPDATGTDPLNADTDGDTLLDGVENPTLPYDSENPTTQPGTDPNDSDTDGDGIGDGSEIANGTDPTTEDEADESSYRQSFDGFPDGTIDLDDGSIIAGTAAEIVDGRLQLTKDGQGLGFSSFSVPAIEGSSRGFRITFDYELYDGPGANNPADGFSVNYGDAQLGELGQAEEGMAGGQATENLSFEIDTWSNGDPEQGVNISGVAGGADLGELAFTNGVIINDGQRTDGKVEIVWQPDLGATFITTGLNTNADFVDVDTSDFTPNDDFTFIISARVGGANEDLFIDNLVIQAGIFDLDADEDNLPDVYENDVAGNITSLDGLGTGPGPGEGTGDFDGDGITDFVEFENRTDPTKEDTDGDGLADGVESGTGEWVSADDTGTDPVKADSDGDGLLDGVENPDLPYDPDNPEDQPGSDPNLVDTDDDTVSDGQEIAKGRDPSTAQAAPRGYVQDFDGFPDGTTDLGDGSVIAGAAAEVIDGRLQLTKDGVGLGFSSFTIPAIRDSANGWTVTFDIEIFDGPGANDPADGFSFNYGNFELGELGRAEEGMETITNVTDNLSFEVDTWRNGDAEQGVNIAEQTDGFKNDVEFTNGVILDDGQRVEGTMEISYNPATGASFKTEGLNTNADFEDAVLTTFVGDNTFNFGISARVGGANQDLFIDNFVLSLGTLGAPFQITEVIRDGTEVNLTWASRPGRIYLIERSEDMENDADDSNRDGIVGFWEEVDDGVESEGETTTFTDEIPEDSKKMFWRITDMGPAE